MAACRAAELSPALRRRRDPEDLGVPLRHGQSGAFLSVLVDDGRFGFPGDLGTGDHDAPIHGCPVSPGEPPGFAGLGRKDGAVSDLLLSFRKRNLNLHPITSFKFKRTGLRRLLHLSLHPERSVNVVLVFNILVESADNLTESGFATPVGERFIILILEVEDTLERPKFLGQHELEGVTGLRRTVRDAPLRSDPGNTPLVEHRLLVGQFRDLDAGSIDRRDFSRPGLGTRDNNPGQPEQGREDESQWSS